MDMKHKDTNLPVYGEQAFTEGSNPASVPVRAALEAMFSQPTPREQYQAQTRHAAILERGRQYRQAQHQWLEAAMFAQGSLDRHWCESRAAWCGRQRSAASPDTGEQDENR